jgi:ubiquitin C-terminal hydrolase
MNNMNTMEKVKYEKIGLCGFNNMGNTCYMNSVIQLIIHSRIFINFLLCENNPYNGNDNDNSDSSFIDMVIKNENKAPFIKFLKNCSLERLADLIRKKYRLDSDAEVKININDLKIYMENTLTIKLAELVNTLIYCGNSCITPTGIKKIIDKNIPRLRGFDQQDAHELLIGIFDILIEETGIDSEPIINNVPDSVKSFLQYLEEIKSLIKKTNSIEEKKKYIMSVNEYKEQNMEVINKYNGLKFMTNVFEIKRKNSLDTSTTGYNPLIFNLLTFDVNTFKCVNCNNCINKYEFNTILSLDVKPTLEECFENYIKEEMIERKCEICSNNNTIKKKLIWRPGMLLFIQLCRFNNLPNGKVCKNNQSVKIPKYLNLSEYCDNSMKTDKSLTYQYKLKGISNHSGSLNGGHYTANAVSITDNETWYNFDDSRVGKFNNGIFDTSDILDSSSAYILMYEMELN